MSRSCCYTSLRTHGGGRACTQVNLLSKIDLIERYGELAFGLDFYTDVVDPVRLLPFLLEREGK